MKSNFEFLSDHFPKLAILGNLAEDYLKTDGNSCLMKLSLFGETIVSLMIEFDNIELPEVENTQVNKLNLLKKKGLISCEIDDVFCVLRKARNKVEHEGCNSTADAMILLKMAHHLGIWFMQIYGNWTYEPMEFVLPENKKQVSNYEAMLKEKEDIIVELQKNTARHFPVMTATGTERALRVKIATEQLNLSGAETRYIINEQLGKAQQSQSLLLQKHPAPKRPKPEHCQMVNGFNHR